MYDNRKRLLTILIIAALIFSLFTLYISSEERLSLSARSAALYEPETNRFIYTKNSNERLGMASTTKIMTALIALENLEENEVIIAPDEACGIEGSSIYLEPGESLSAIDLVYALMLQSANDAACVLAYRIAGGIESFAELMNAKASELGLLDTHFTNPHGLDDEEHYTTAHDLALLSAEAIKNESLQKITSTVRKKIESSLKTRTLINHNKMLRFYDGCIGLKTGYTKRCGRCLVSCAKKDGLYVIAVSIDAPDDWKDHTKMLDHAYSLLEKRLLCERGDFSYDIPLIGGSVNSARISASEDFSVVVEKNSPEIEYTVKLSGYFSAPITKGDVLGKVIFTSEGKEIGRVDLIAEATIDAPKPKKKFFSFIY